MKNNAKNKLSDLETKEFDPKLDNEARRIKKLEMALKDSENKFKEAESIAHFGFWELDPVTLNRKWTDGLFNIVGYNPGSGNLKHYTDNKKIIHPDDWDHFYNASQTVINTGKDVEIDARVIRLDGSLRIFHIIAKPKSDENGKVIGVRGTAQDITDLKRMENRLKKSETFYRTLFEHTGTATIIVDEDSTISMANTQFEKLSGYSKNEIEGKKCWKDIVVVEDREQMEKYHLIRLKGSELPPESYEIQLIDKAGNIKIILLNVAIIPGTKKTVASLLDLTARKKMEQKIADSERKYKYIVEKSSAGIFLLDKNGTIKYLNEQMAHLLNYSKNEMLETHIKNFVGEEEFYNHKNQSKNQIIRFDGFKFLNRKGKTLWTILTVSPIYNSKKEYTGLLGIVTDIGLQKGLEEAFLDREEILTDIIYDMMEILNNIAMDEGRSEFNEKDLSRTFEKILKNS
jgi:PAS domain S-box-containing protein